MNDKFDTMEDDLPTFCVRNPVWIFCWNGNELTPPEYPRQLKARGTMNGRRQFMDRQNNLWNHARLMTPHECSLAGAKYLEVPVESKAKYKD